MRYAEFGATVAVIILALVAAKYAAVGLSHAGIPIQAGDPVKRPLAPSTGGRTGVTE